MSLKVFILAFITVVGVESTFIDYYWRDYYGQIPEDAIPGGLDLNGKRTYIAQLFVHNNGILPTRLYKGEKSVTASRYGIHTSDVYIKILCSRQKEKFLWVPATSRNLHVETIGKNLVVGGTENGKVLNIGRIQYQGEVIVGKVCGYHVGDAKMFFPYKNQEQNAEAYQVLVFDNNTITDVDSQFLILSSNF